MSVLSLSQAAHADLGLSQTVRSLGHLVLDRPDSSLAVCFTVREDMEARVLAMACDQAQDAPSYIISLHSQSKGKPGALLAQATGLVATGPGWLQGHLDGLSLKKGQQLCLVITADLLRGGTHPVEMPSASRYARLRLAELSPPGARAWIAGEDGWAATKQAPVWAILGRGKRIIGNAWHQDLSLPIHGNASPEDVSDDVWQAQVFHFACGFKLTALRARVRKIGSPVAPLRAVFLKHDYMAHKTRPLFESELATPAKVGKDWSWIEMPLPKDLASFAPECHYFALRTAAGSADGQGCRDCYEVSGARVLAGLELVQELTWHGGAHRDRRSFSSSGGGHWRDDFDADLHVVALGPPCVSTDLMPNPSLLPTPAPLMRWQP